ncbi:hypothetical protein [Arenibacter sp. F20364]|uniref:hypothetical protein n=1 Tax=Arenibacter sp. F20364 TaxID=2926415 RepID=UPI001FF3D073|nr:hypothetical protein [Arenibacter sp. F20364]MCK0191547.1 hypothetical protein [Arenibacter sp. F20364]
MRSLLLFLFLLGVSCSGQKRLPKDRDVSSSQNSKELQLVLQDNYSGVEQTEFQVIRDSKALKNFFLQINKTRKPGLPIPEVDFSRELLLVYCAGTSLGIDRSELVIVEDSEDNIVIGLKEHTSVEKEYPNVATMPFCIYKMPLTPKKISFQKLK